MRLLVLYLTLTSADIIYRTNSSFTSIYVERSRHLLCLRFLLAPAPPEGCVDTLDRHRIVFEYTQRIVGASVLLLSRSPQKILVLGLGCGTLARAFEALYPDAHVHNVEVDEGVVATATRFFGVRRSTITPQDAYEYIRATTYRYDLIVADAFDSAYIPHHLRSSTFFKHIRSAMAPRGLLIANTFRGSRSYRSEFEQYTSVFPHVLSFTRPSFGNRLILATSHPFNASFLHARAERWEPALRPFDVSIRSLASDVTRIIDDKFLTWP